MDNDLDEVQLEYKKKRNKALIFSILGTIGLIIFIVLMVVVIVLLLVSYSWDHGYDPHGITTLNTLIGFVLLFGLDVAIIICCPVVFLIGTTLIWVMYYRYLKKQKKLLNIANDKDKNINININNKL